MHRTLWWMSAQAGLRTLYGLLLWLTWAVHPPAEAAKPLANAPESAILHVASALTFRWKVRCMTVSLSSAVQDYLKAIHALGGAEKSSHPMKLRRRLKCGLPL